MSSSLPSGSDGVTVSLDDLPLGYKYRVTRYADIILRDAFPQHWYDLTSALAEFQIDLEVDMLRPGGNRTEIAARFDGSLRDRGWGKENMDIETRINEELVAKVRSHEIDMFKLGVGSSFPGVAVEMEWNNKDPFFDRDLSNFYALHRAGALAVGVIVTRGPKLQRAVTPIAKAHGLPTKYGASTTHWDKLMPRVDILSITHKWSRQNTRFSDGTTSGSRVGAGPPGETPRESVRLRGPQEEDAERHPAHNMWG